MNVNKNIPILPERSCRKRYEKIEERIIAIDVANTFNILSAYFTATATIKPPNAYFNIQTFLITTMF